MSLLEKLAVSLDAEGIAGRINEEILYVPLGSGVELRLVAIDPDFPAIALYIDDDVLVSVAFSLDDALALVFEHLATDDLVTMMRDLVDGTDGRLTDLAFHTDPEDADSIWAEVGSSSTLVVDFLIEDNTACAAVTFTTESEEDFLDLGTYDDADRLVEVLAFARDHAEMWEEELTPFE